MTTREVVLREQWKKLDWGHIGEKVRAEREAARVHSLLVEFCCKNSNMQPELGEEMVGETESKTGGAAHMCWWV